jgi:4-methylaminobutanoate oxidase (formaldehyde-forming)
VSDDLPSHAEIVIIGGGIIGCSTAYHLARDHKAEVIVLEQNQLTSGSTWHAAGLVGQLRSSASITQLLKYSVSLYQRLEAETGLATGWKMTGCLRLATNQDRMIEFRRLATTARSFGMEMHLISPAEVKRMWPLMEVSDLVGASFLPTDGQASPSDITQSLAKGARMHGARFFEGVRVTGFGFDGARITRVDTNRGAIACERIVNCGGQWARQIGALAGVSVPLQPMKHQYIVTEPIPGLARDAPTLRDPDRRTYFKEEVGGLVMGGYEPDPEAWTTGDVADDFAFRLFDDDFDHFEPHMLNGIARVPALEKVGVRRMIHAPESFTSDGNFILGRAPECTNFFVGAGFNAFGIASGGGAGWALAHWVATGEAPLDLWPVDIRRFSAVHANRDWLRERVIEATAKHYTIAYPHEEYQSGRPRLVSPLYQTLKARGAVFGSKLGWERANWFAPAGVEPRDVPSMGRPNWFDAVAEEHRAARERVAIFDQSSFAKFELIGADAGRALSFLCAGDVAKPPGRLTYTQMLNPRGGVECDLTIARLAPDHFLIITGTGFRTHDAAWISDHVAPGLDARLIDVTEARATLAVMGPRARELLRRVSRDDVSNAGFPFGHVRAVEIAGRPTLASRVTYVGELGWELTMENADALAIFDALMAEGESLGVALGGYRAIESLRLEKGYRAWGADVTPNDDPYEAGLGFAVSLQGEREFLGRPALLAARGAPLKKRLCCFICDDEEVTLIGRETILRDGEPVGYLSSGGHGHTLKRPIGLGYVKRGEGVDVDWLRAGRYELVVAERRTACRLSLDSPYDPSGARVRG